MRQKNNPTSLLVACLYAYARSAQGAGQISKLKTRFLSIIRWDKRMVTKKGTSEERPGGVYRMYKEWNEVKGGLLLKGA